jgi:hypothetical protein
VDDAARRKEAARQTRKEQNDLALDELDEAAQFDQEKVSRARTEATKIYQDTHMLADERFDRIRRVLESYKVDVSVLPKAIREFMEEEGDADTI